VIGQSDLLTHQPQKLWARLYELVVTKLAKAETSMSTLRHNPRRSVFPMPRLASERDVHPCAAWAEILPFHSHLLAAMTNNFH